MYQEIRNDLIKTLIRGKSSGLALRGRRPLHTNFCCPPSSLNGLLSNSVPSHAVEENGSTRPCYTPPQMNRDGGDPLSGLSAKPCLLDLSFRAPFSSLDIYSRAFRFPVCPRRCKKRRTIPRRPGSGVRFSVWAPLTLALDDVFGSHRVDHIMS